jgi:hypothetical protein
MWPSPVSLSVIPSGTSYPREVDASFGRMPNIHQSGETDHPGAIARIADAPVGAALFEVALTG